MPAAGAADPAQERAAQWLAQARQSGDHVKQVAALTELGILAQRDGDVPRAVTLLTEALATLRTVVG